MGFVLGHLGQKQKKKKKNGEEKEEEEEEEEVFSLLARQLRAVGSFGLLGEEAVEKSQVFR